jgi:hypothetical protein
LRRVYPGKLVIAAEVQAVVIAVEVEVQAVEVDAPVVVVQAVEVDAPVVVEVDAPVVVVGVDAPVVNALVVNALVEVVSSRVVHRTRAMKRHRQCQWTILVKQKQHNKRGVLNKRENRRLPMKHDADSTCIKHANL